MKRKCRKCGGWIRLLPVATDLVTGQDITGWCAPTAPTAVCSVFDGQTGERHVPELLV